MPHFPSLADDASLIDVYKRHPAVAVAGLYAVMNPIVDGHGIRADADAVEAGGTRLAEVGCAGLAKLLANPE
ncbi:MAG: hypothetical protein AAFR04_06175 [Pseudomonadota bacterium]